MSENSTAPLDAQDYSEALQAIDRYIDAYKVGDVHAYAQPFTDQFRQDIRANYREDADKFEELDGVLRDVKKTYRLLCAYSAACLAGFLFIPVAVFKFLTASPLQNTPVYYYIEGGILVLMWAVMATARHFRRKHILDLHLVALTTTAAERASHRIVEIISTLKSICSAIAVFDEQLPPNAWADRGRELCKIALWHSDRAQGLDHFATTVYWKIRNDLSMTECLVRLYSGLMMVAAIAVLLAEFGTPSQFEHYGFMFGCLSAMLVWGAIWCFTFVRAALAKIPPATTPSRWRGLAALVVAYAVFAGIWLAQQQLNLESAAAIVFGLIMLIGTWWPWLTRQYPNDKLGVEFTSALHENLPKGYSPVCHYEDLSGALAHLIGNIVALRMPQQGGGWHG